MENIKSVKETAEYKQGYHEGFIEGKATGARLLDNYIAKQVKATMLIEIREEETVNSIKAKLEEDSHICTGKLPY